MTKVTKDDDITEWTDVDVQELHLVGQAATGLPALIAKARQSVSAEQKRRDARTGVAQPNDDFDFSIVDEPQLRSAIDRVGNYKGDKAAARAHIITRAKELGLLYLIPANWHTKKGSTDMSKQLKKAIRKAIATQSIGLGPDRHISGAGSTAASRMSRDAYMDLFHEATSQPGRPNAQAAHQVIKGFDDRVEQARKMLKAAAGDDFATARATTALRDALRQRCVAKLLIADNVGANRGRFPNSTDLFGGSSHTLGEDSGVHYLEGRR
jgi:hypothetical protein